MVIDTSAICAIFFDEPEAKTFLDTILAAPFPYFSAVSFIETTILLNSRTISSVKHLDRFLRQAGVEVVPVNTEISLIASEAYQRFGKGHHPAALNFGDVFSYATAKFLDQPLLYKGNDFSNTDITGVVIT